MGVKNWLSAVFSTGRSVEAEALAHVGAGLSGGDLARWNPPSLSGDGAILPEMGKLRTRSEDAIRNNGFVSGAIASALDNVVGEGLKLSAKPDYTVLGQDEMRAQEWQRPVEAYFRQWANDPDHFCDTTRQQDFGGLTRKLYRSKLTSFEGLAIADWSPRRGGRYSTSIQIIDPARLCNPDGKPDSELLRGGVRLNRKGVATGYWIKSNLDGDPTRWGGLPQWKLVPRETPWGRQRVFHTFDVDKPGTNRGKNGLVSVLKTLKSLETFDEATLQAALLNAMYAMSIKSPMDWEAVGSALGVESPTKSYMQDRAIYHKDKGIQFDGAKVPHLFPGEELDFATANHPGVSYSMFQSALLRELAAGLNISYEQLSRDYSNTNYSSARASMLESWKSYSTQRKTVAGAFASWCYALWLEEAIDKGDVKIPAGAPSFLEAKTAWTRCDWIGPPQGHIDPLKEKKAIELGIKIGTTTLDIECAAQGQDWEQVVEQRGREAKKIMETAQKNGVDPSMMFPNYTPTPEVFNEPTE